MQTYKTDIKVHRGELFSLDFVLVNPDGSPYVFSSKSNNPYFLITISSTKYEQSGRYVKNYWLKIDRSLLFYNTNAVKIDNFDSIPNVDIGDYDGDVSGYSIYYTEDSNGVRTYKRWNGIEFVDYEMRIVKTFNSDDTMSLPGQSYVYSINYVDGDDMLQYLKNCYELEYGTSDDMSKEEYYNKLIAVKYDTYKDIKWERELHSISINVPIINPSKLSIINDIDGGVYEGN